MARGRGAWIARSVPLWALLSGMAVPALARAQTVPSIDASTWRPSPDPEASLVLEPAVTAGAWRWNLGAWTQYAADPVVFRNRGGQSLRAVAQFVGVDLAGSLGLGERVS